MPPSLPLVHHRVNASRRSLPRVGDILRCLPQSANHLLPGTEEQSEDFMGKVLHGLAPKAAGSSLQRGELVQDSHDRMAAMFERETGIGCCGRRQYGADIIDELQ